MAIRTVINFDRSKIPYEGSPTFRADASYVWSKMPDVIDSINGAIGDINDTTLPISNNIEAIIKTSDNIEDVKSFSKVYMGGQDSDPTTRPDGTALEAGDLYFNIPNKELRVFNGTNWQNKDAQIKSTFKSQIINVSTETDTFNIDGGYDSRYILVYLNGYKQINGEDVDVSSGSFIKFAKAIPAGSKLEIVMFSEVSIVDGDITINLSTTQDADKVVIKNTAGDNATIQKADTTKAGVMSANDKIKLNGIENNATADMTPAEIKTAYESNPNTNCLTNVLKNLINHDNRNVLNNLGESNNKLTYKGQEISGGSTNETVVVYDGLDSNSSTEALSAKQGKILNDNKVDKINGKGLSTNDLTNSLKNKITHSNRSVLDNLGENNNKLTYNGEEIGNNITVYDGLDSTSSENALSAKQGKTLNDNKVDKVSGKGLSTNDFTNAFKNLLTSFNIANKLLKLNSDGKIPLNLYRNIAQVQTAEMYIIRKDDNWTNWHYDYGISYSTANITYGTNAEPNKVVKTRGFFFKKDTILKNLTLMIRTNSTQVKDIELFVAFQSADYENSDIYQNSQIQRDILVHKTFATGTHSIQVIIENSNLNDFVCPKNGMLVVFMRKGNATGDGLSGDKKAYTDLIVDYIIK